MGLNFQFCNVHVYYYSQVERNLDTGELLNFYELPVEGIGQTAKNSTSLARAPGKATDDVRGNRANYPFWPGGFDPPSFHQLSQENFDIDFEHGGILVKLIF